MEEDDVVATSFRLCHSCNSLDHSRCAKARAVAAASDASPFMLLDADLRDQVLQALLNTAASEGSPGELFEAASTLGLVRKDWGAGVKPVMKAKIHSLLAELSQLGELEDISEEGLREGRELGLSAAFKGREVDTHRVNMLLAVVHSNGALETLKVDTCRLNVRELSGVQATAQIALDNNSVGGFDAFVIGALIKGNGEAAASVLLASYRRPIVHRGTNSPRSGE